MNMYENVDYIELVKQAQLGNQGGMDSLAKLAGWRVCAYLYKLTLDYNLAQDLSQETLLEMVESLKNLKHPDRFWAWLFRTALGKAQLYFRDRQRQHEIRMSVLEKERLVQLNSSADNDGLSKITRKELSDAICEAMVKLKFSHRNVLILRCFEQMSHSEIANIIDRSELQTRALFFRAKRTLRRQLARDGFGKGWVLAALGIFARLTTPAKASTATVTAASTKVGLAGTILGAAGTKLGAVITTAVTIAAITVGSITTVNDNNNSAPLSKVTFKYPSRLVDSYDSEGDGWAGTPFWPGRHFSPVALDKYLVGPPLSATSIVVLRAGDWVELKFNGTIVDGPGDDIIVAKFGKCGERARVFITDSAGNEYLLGIATAGIKKQSPYSISTKIGFDISDISLPFVPRAVRILGMNNKGPIPGFKLCSVRARINSKPKDFIKILFEIREPDIEEENGDDPISPSYQTVIWLEDESGKYVKSLLVSEWLSYGGYKRPVVCVTWSKLADWANVSKEEFDAVTQATPYYGENELIIDCTKRGLLPGTYYYCVQTHVVDEYNILYRGQIKIGQKNDENTAEVKYIPDKFPLGEKLLCDVKAQYYQ